MIAQLEGSLLRRELDAVLVMTAGGVGYEVSIPLGVYDKLPAVGERVSLLTHLVVREDGWQLFGFSTTLERDVFRRLLDAKGVGPSLALGMMSALSAERLVRAIREKDIAALQSIPRIGRRKAEQLVLDLADKLDDLAAEGAGASRAGGAAAADAVRALISLGYAAADADRAVREVVEEGGGELGATELIRRALANVGGRR